MPLMPRPGEQFRVTVGYDRIDDAVALNEAARAHLWIVIVTYGLTDEEAAVASEGVEQLLDGAHLLAVVGIGCYICEQRYKDVVGKPCTGKPR
jgi:hypothetical protein